MSNSPILVRGATGKVGAAGRTIVERLRQRKLLVRALVRRYDERAEALSALGAEVVVGDPIMTYVDVPLEEWRDQKLRGRGLPDHVFGHFVTMAWLHAENRYDRMTQDVEAILARPATTVRSYVERRTDQFR